MRSHNTAFYICSIIMPRLIDAFIFYNEIAMLKYRLHLLYPVVDSFVLVESTLTFSGSPKHLYFENHKAEFQEYLDKIIHIVVDDMPSHTQSAWDREHFQRNAIDRGLQKLSLRPDDIIQLSDVDEIPNPDILKLSKQMNINKVYNLYQHTYYYNPTLRSSYTLPTGKLFPYGIYCSKYNKILKNIRGDNAIPFLPNGGWHFSYFGSADFIINKIKTFSHQEYNIPAITNKQHIESSIQEKKDLFGRRIEYEYIPLEENPNLPPDIHLLLEYLDQPLTKPAIPAPSP